MITISIGTLWDEFSAESRTPEVKRALADGSLGFGYNEVGDRQEARHVAKASVGTTDTPKSRLVVLGFGDAIFAVAWDPARIRMTR